jgi:hypothetical protein
MDDLWPLGSNLVGVLPHPNWEGLKPCPPAKPRKTHIRAVHVRCRVRRKRLPGDRDKREESREERHADDKDCGH